MITWSYVGRPATEVPRIGYAEIERDPVTGDVRLHRPGDSRVRIALIRGPDAVIQRIRQKMSFVKGEWYLDTQKGVPYREFIWVKHPDIGLVTSIYRRVLIGTPGVGSVKTMRVVPDFRTRVARVSFEALLTDPSIIVRAVDAPFIL